MPRNIGELANIIVDCRDNERVASFWSEVLGLEIAQRSHPYVDLAASTNDAPTVGFQQVAEPAITKNRIHLDVKVEDLEVATERIRAMGGRLLKECVEGPSKWRVMADPEDNEFCLVTG